LIKIFCRYTALTDLSSEVDLTIYHEFVRPLDYDFGLERNADYQVIGILERGGTPWVYVTPTIGDIELAIVPAVLFSFEGAVIPSGMVVRFAQDQRPSLEILPQSLSEIDHWFERYLGDDDEVVKIIESIAGGGL
jgi:hypothetical protein